MQYDALQYNMGAPHTAVAKRAQLLARGPVQCTTLRNRRATIPYNPIQIGAPQTAAARLRAKHRSLPPQSPPVVAAAAAAGCAYGACRSDRRRSRRGALLPIVGQGRVLCGGLSLPSEM